MAEGGDEFAADSGNGLQQKLAEIAEGDGLLLGDAALRKEKKNLGEGAVDVGGCSEIAQRASSEGRDPSFTLFSRDVDPDRIDALEP